MYASIPQSTLIARHNKLDPLFEGPIIGVCFDWRTSESGERSYMPFIYNKIRDAVEKGGGRLYILTFSDRYEDVKDRIHGLLIPGGRDLDPENYGQENAGSRFNKEDAKLRFDHMSDFLQNGDPGMPIMGVCLGL